ncbi:MAG: Hydrogenase-4 component B [Lentisphaerae bacterium ADurb.BinA184]|nr:MAG: Hydrogenase-4 component B [Lentisphaerae bacterium ADurb.BinA184]
MAICGLPPLNGFVSEFILYFGAVQAALSPAAAVAVPALALVAGLALFGGLAAACFAKAFGVIFLGEPRSEDGRDARETPAAMLVPMTILAAACFALGLLGPLAAGVAARAVPSWGGLTAAAVKDQMAPVVHTLSLVSLVGGGAAGLVILLAGLRFRQLRRRQATQGTTWDCGYAEPTPRMQYTATSFAQPLTALFRPLLRTRLHIGRLSGLFPEGTSLHTETPDLFRQRVIEPFLEGAWRELSGLRRFQHGQAHLYVLYIAVTLLILLLWKLA